VPGVAAAHRSPVRVRGGRRVGMADPRSDDRWLGMRRNRWLFPMILIVLVAVGTVGWLRRGTAGGTTAAGATTSPAGDGGCALTEVPNTEVDKEIWNGIARVRQGVLAAGTRYAGSQFNGI